MSPEEIKILIIDEVHQVLLDRFKDFNLMYRPDITADELNLEIALADVLIMRSKVNLNRSYLKHAPNLKIIGRLGSGMDNIDVEVAEERRIHCLNAPEGNRDSVAEQTIGMLLSLLNNLPKARRELEQGIWNRKGNSGTELSELCVGIIGYGNTGTSLAAKLKAFGCRIIAYDLHLKEFSSPGIEEVDLARLQSESDVISVHVPLDSSSRHLINGEFFRKLAKPIYLLNVSRGSVVETKALIQAFKEGKLRGAGLDVLENENLDSMDEEEKAQFEFLLNHPAVILSPHIAGLTSSSFFRLSDILSRRILEKMDEIHLLTQNRL